MDGTEQVVINVLGLVNPVVQSVIGKSARRYHPLLASEHRLSVDRQGIPTLDRPLPIRLWCTEASHFVQRGIQQIATAKWPPWTSVSRHPWLAPI